MHHILLRVATLAALLALAAGSSAGTVTLPIDAWLVCEPKPLQLPVFGDPADAEALLDATELKIAALRPEVHETMSRTTTGWRRLSQPIVRTDPQPARYSFMAASYLKSSAWQKGTLTLSSDAPLRVYLNGEQLGQCARAKEGKFAVSEEVELPRGKHILLVQQLSLDGKAVSLRGEWDGNSLEFTQNADYSFANFEDQTLFDDIPALAFSPTGRYIAYVTSTYGHTTKKETWLEVLDTETQRTIHVQRPVKGVGHVGWFPDHATLYFTTTGTDGDDIWMTTFPEPYPQCVKRNVRGLVKVAAGSNPHVLYFTADEEVEEPERDWSLWDELEDRMDDWTRTRALFAVNSLDGTTRRLTAIADSFALDDFTIGPNDSHILFTRRIPQLERPYYQTEFWLYETATGTGRKVLTQLLPFETRPLSLTWIDSVHVAYVTAAYETRPDDTLDRNSTQTAVWLLNIQTGMSRPLNPGVHYSVDEDEGGALHWNPAEGKLWMRVIRGSEIQLMRIDPFAENPQAEPIRLSRTVVGDFGIARDGRCALIASDPLHPNALIEYDPATATERILRDGNQVLLLRSELPTWERWNFENSRGDTIEGFVYYPPEYRPELSRSWPLIVYYYGGVSPRDLRFRYTYLWWAANGYVVYVLNPSGTIGYNPEFADRHSNDWGTMASQDIIEGTRKLLDEKRFLDRGRVGAYGGSYGGFITLDLATKTNLFAALCSMSGISNIASYFGGGTWGFTYGDIALPRSFPWNRRDVFVDKSPLFHADQITTPLLLTHGDADVNVPVGESDQMFVALKLLGRDVAEVRFKGEDHGFAKFENRVVEMNVVLEWFDMYLKGEGEGWKARWKE